jgi:hypothetical protein
VIYGTPIAQQTAEFHNGGELTQDQCKNFQMLLYDDFPELMPPMDSPHVSRNWDDPIETTGPMKRNRLNVLPLAKRVGLIRQLKDAIEAGLIRPSQSKLSSPIHIMRKADGSLRLCIDYRGFNEVSREDAYPLPRVDDTLDELKDANYCTHLDLAYGYW